MLLLQWLRENIYCFWDGDDTTINGKFIKMSQPLGVHHCGVICVEGKLYLVSTQPECCRSDAPELWWIDAVLGEVVGSELVNWQAEGF